MPRKAPLPSWSHCFSPSLPHGRFLLTRIPPASWHWVALPAHPAWGEPISGKLIRRPHISSGFRPGHLLHRQPLPHSVSLVPQGLAPGPCPPVPRPASCSPHRLFSILYITVLYNQIHLVGGSVSGCHPCSGLGNPLPWPLLPTTHPTARASADSQAVRKHPDLNPRAPRAWVCHQEDERLSPHSSAQSWAGLPSGAH